MIRRYKPRTLALAGGRKRGDATARDIAATDRRIDALIYDLYGLTEEEVQLVESSTERE